MGWPWRAAPRRPWREQRAGQKGEGDEHEGAQDPCLLWLDDPLPWGLDLLRAGGSDTPQALLARIGLDVSDPGFWDGGLAVLEDLVAEAEALAE